MRLVHMQRATSPADYVTIPYKAFPGLKPTLTICLQLSPHKRPLNAVDAWPRVTSKLVNRVIGQKAVASALLAGYLEG
jgi:hypothetical protein